MDLGHQAVRHNNIAEQHRKMLNRADIKYLAQLNKTNGLGLC